ncbi:MAG: glycosyltransferase family 2 protein, partial [Actinomycetota bacterium]|nr:glycosyltransferase family 2 protein [Actinomycetota bacterium]
PFLNRFVGNPILTGMLNLFFGVKVSDAHCGMRAIRKDAAEKLDLHSTGMEFASEMVFKAYNRGLKVSEIPIDYFPRIGESKLNRFSVAWRHVRFMLLYSPSWLYLVPGVVLMLLGLTGMIVLATGPVDIFGRTWQIHTMLGFVALTLIGAQVIQLGVFARTYARVTIGEHDPLLERLGRRLRLEHGLLAGGALVLLAIAGLAAIGTEWAMEGFGDLGRAYETALLATTLGLGMQVIFGAFFLALLTMPLRRR